MGVIGLGMGGGTCASTRPMFCVRVGIGCKRKLIVKRSQGYSNVERVCATLMTTLVAIPPLPLPLPIVYIYCLGLRAWNSRAELGEPMRSIPW